MEAYGLSVDITDDELLENLLKLNLEYAEEEASGVIAPP